MYSPETIQLRPNVPPAMQEPARKMLANYYAHCTALDDCMGQLETTLEQTGLANDTLVIFTSDHGDMLGSQAGRDKQQPYDESIRVPLLLHWPAAFGTAPPELPALIGSEDLMPTLLGLCHLRIPSSVEGTDYSGYLFGGKNPSDGATLISCAAPFGEWSRRVGGREYRGIRTARFTYVRDLEGAWMLYDDEKDPYQLHNLVGQPEYARVQADLDACLKHKLAAVHDLFLPGESYVQQWGYHLDKDGTVPYTD
jgi:arylsulfatase A-like enzyme